MKRNFREMRNCSFFFNEKKFDKNRNSPQANGINLEIGIKVRGLSWRRKPREQMVEETLASRAARDLRVRSREKSPREVRRKTTDYGPLFIVRFKRQYPGFSGFFFLPSESRRDPANRVRVRHRATREKLTSKTSPFILPKGMTFIFYVSRATFFENQCGSAEKTNKSPKNKHSTSLRKCEMRWSRSVRPRYHRRHH